MHRTSTDTTPTGTDPFTALEELLRTEGAYAVVDRSTLR